jgi:hypothetical protein
MEKASVGRQEEAFTKEKIPKTAIKRKSANN